MRVLLCSPTLRVGGITKWTGYISDYFNANPCKDLLLDLFPMNNSTYLGDNASKVKRIIAGVPAYLKVVSQFKKTLKSNKPDVVHICSSASLGLIRDLLMLNICHRYKVKACIHLHFGRTPDLLDSNNWESKLLRKVISKADSIVVMNKSSHESLLTHGYKNGFNIPNPLSPQIISLVEKCDKVREAKKLIFVGHILQTKGIEELLGAMNQLVGYHLVLIGEDTMKIVQTLKEKYPLAFKQNNIEFIGQQSHERVIEEMKTGTFVFPSHTEGFPNVILESMACGSPIIASSVGSIPEMLGYYSNNPCGIIVPPKDIESITSSIRKLTNNSELANEMGRNAKKMVHELYNITTVISQLTNCWRKTYQS